MKADASREVRAALVVFGAVAACSASAAGSGDALSLLAPSDRGLRSDIAWLVDRGVIELPLGIWPLASSGLRAGWAGVDEARLAPADADALARVRRAVQRSTDSARLALRGNSARHPSLDGGSAAKGVASGTLSLYAGNANVGGQLSLYAVGDSLTPGWPQGSLEGSYVVARADGVVFGAGVVDRWWGPGVYTSPILSTAAPPIAGAFVRRAEDSAPQPPWPRWIGRETGRRCGSPSRPRQHRRPGAEGSGSRRRDRRLRPPRFGCRRLAGAPASVGKGPASAGPLRWWPAACAWRRRPLIDPPPGSGNSSWNAAAG